MKTFFKILVLVLLVSFQSCSKGEIEEVNLVEEKKSIEASKAFAASNNQAEEGTLENKMQWGAYLVTRALFNKAAEDDFLNLLTSSYNNNNNNNTVRLDDLLNSSNGAFRNAFAEAFDYYTNVDACDTDGGKPRGAAVPDNEGNSRPGFQAQNNETTSRVGQSFPPPASDLYINQLINNYNFEIFLPNGYVELKELEELEDFYKIISTAVTNNLITNEAYSHSEYNCHIVYTNMTTQTQGNIVMMREY
ncbi:hypothetical protein [uncultured Lacinutrix sp.]|uniref:hypothetical protein n=1 Tax=uncultured Lacinutrix sp. TaxID=574032 RepID=UPI00263957F5|nr:hypothetical protein [uncultured Lacinutrix sp.]